MSKKKIFISSVQTEFVKERKALHEYILADPLLGKFFEPFLFELLPAIDQRVDAVYLREVEQSDIYLGLLGKEYGIENKNGISSTELEFDQATKHHKTRLLFLSAHPNTERHPKEVKFISKTQKVLIRKRFSRIDDLKSAVYATLVRYLEEKEIIRLGPFDASPNPLAKSSDLSAEKVKAFVRLARSKRGFALTEEVSMNKVLLHLNLLNGKKISNAAILLFAKEPQRFFINSEVRCAYFHSTVVEKPIPSYKVFKGDVFELVNQAVEFVLSKLDYSVGTRAQHTSIPGAYEIPKEIIAEALVNAVAHRDYTSNASVQIMLFKDRLEIWNPGSLPLGWTTEKLKKLHTSVPANPLLAEPMYLAGFIERLGTGTADIVRIAMKAGLKEPEYIQDEIFKTIIYRSQAEQVPGKYRASTGQVPDKYRTSSPDINKLVMVLEGEAKRSDLQKKLELRHREHFIENYLQPSIDEGFVEMTIPEKPNSSKQRYRLTPKGKMLKKYLIGN